MIKIIMEAELPKLTDTSYYKKFNETSDITKAVAAEIKNTGKRIKPEDIEEIISLIKLNGSSVSKKAIEAFKAGKIVIIFNKETSAVPQSLPFIVGRGKDGFQGYVFADQFMNNIKSSQEYQSLNAVLSACYMALITAEKPSVITNNRNLILTMCDLYIKMVTAPLETKLYMKGENLTKALAYAMAYYYRMIDGPSDMTVPFRRLIGDNINVDVEKSIIEDVKALPNMDFENLINLFVKINPIRYKDLPGAYMQYFFQTCGSPLIFALENFQYLWLAAMCATIKSTIIGYGFGKSISDDGKNITKMLATMNF